MSNGPTMADRDHRGEARAMDTGPLVGFRGEALEIPDHRTLAPRVGQGFGSRPNARLDDSPKREKWHDEKTWDS